jgi:hypothetical protein
MNRKFVYEAVFAGDTDWVLVTAANSTEAAENFAHSDDFRTNEFAIAKGGTAVVCIRLKDSSAITTFEVTGQLVPEYTAVALP